MAKYRIVVKSGYYSIQRKENFYEKWVDFTTVHPPINSVVDQGHTEFIKAAQLAVETVESLKKAEAIVQGQSLLEKGKE